MVEALKVALRRLPGAIARQASLPVSRLHWLLHISRHVGFLSLESSGASRCGGQQLRGAKAFSLYHAVETISRKEKVGIVAPTVHPPSGIQRIARALLAYLGAGAAVVAGGELCGQSTVCASERRSCSSSWSSTKHVMAVAEARVLWQRAVANGILQQQEDAPRGPRLPYCPHQFPGPMLPLEMPHGTGSYGPGYKLSKEDPHPFQAAGTAWGCPEPRSGASLGAASDLQWDLSPSSVEHRNGQSFRHPSANEGSPWSSVELDDCSQGLRALAREGGDRSVTHQGGGSGSSTLADSCGSPAGTFPPRPSAQRSMMTKLTGSEWELTVSTSYISEQSWRSSQAGSFIDNRPGADRVGFRPGTRDQAEQKQDILEREPPLGRSGLPSGPVSKGGSLASQLSTRCPAADSKIEHDLRAPDASDTAVVENEGVDMEWKGDEREGQPAVRRTPSMVQERSPSPVEASSRLGLRLDEGWTVALGLGMEHAELSETADCGESSDGGKWFHNPGWEDETVQAWGKADAEKEASASAPEAMEGRPSGDIEADRSHGSPSLGPPPLPNAVRQGRSRHATGRATAGDPPSSAGPPDEEGAVVVPTAPAAWEECGRTRQEQTLGHDLSRQPGAPRHSQSSPNSSCVRTPHPSAAWSSLQLSQRRSVCPQPSESPPSAPGSTQAAASADVKPRAGSAAAWAAPSSSSSAAISSTLAKSLPAGRVLPVPVHEGQAVPSASHGSQPTILFRHLAPPQPRPPLRRTGLAQSERVNVRERTGSGSDWRQTGWTADVEANSFSEGARSLPFRKCGVTDPVVRASWHGSSLPEGRPARAAAAASAAALAAAQALGDREACAKAALQSMGEALCHSQTRARQAEEGALRVHAEKERLLRLLLAECSLSYAYRQWAAILQAENARFRCGSHGPKAAEPCSCCGHTNKEVLQSLWDAWHQLGAETNESSFFSPSSKEGHSLEVEITLGCIGLAFALGLGFAGAALYYGWSMGWIALAV